MEYLEIVSELFSYHNLRDYLKTIIIFLDVRLDLGAYVATK